MKQHLKQNNLKIVINVILTLAFFISFKPAINNNLSSKRTPLSLSETALITENGSDDATLGSPEVDSFLLIVAITVLGLTSVIGYYIVTKHKGPH